MIVMIILFVMYRFIYPMTFQKKTCNFLSRINVT